MDFLCRSVNGCKTSAKCHLAHIPICTYITLHFSEVRPKSQPANKCTTAHAARVTNNLVAIGLVKRLAVFFFFFFFWITHILRCLTTFLIGINHNKDTHTHPTSQQTKTYAKKKNEILDSHFFPPLISLASLIPQFNLWPSHLFPLSRAGPHRSFT